MDILRHIATTGLFLAVVTTACVQKPAPPPAVSPKNGAAASGTAPPGSSAAVGGPASSGQPGAAAQGGITDNGSNGQVPMIGATQVGSTPTAGAPAPGAPPTQSTPSGAGQGIAVTSANPPANVDASSYSAIYTLNQMRASHGLPAVLYDAGLTQRCYAYAKVMATSVGLNHDSTVYFTDERENIAMDGDTATVQDSMTMWQNSPPHAAAMFDDGFPTAVLGGYGQYQGYSCLRLCPVPHDPSVCNG